MFGCDSQPRAWTASACTKNLKRLLKDGFHHLNQHDKPPFQLVSSLPSAQMIKIKHND
jgi:hypothetical protein